MVYDTPEIPITNLLGKCIPSSLDPVSVYVCVYLVSVCYLYWYVPGSFLYKFVWTRE